MSEVDVYKSRLERTVKIQLSSEARPYGRKDVRKSRKTSPALFSREVASDGKSN